MTKVPLVQCDKCGSKVPPDQIKEGDPWYEIKILGMGMLIGALLRQIILWVQLGMPGI